MLKRLLVAALALVPVQAVHAQTSGAVTNHAFVIGKGAGTTGYTSLLCGSAQLAVGQAAADPICRTLSGDVTLDAAGVTTIGADKVTNSMLAGSIAASKLIGTDIATVGTITSGTWNGTTIAVANGGTGATNASGARTNLGLAIGSNVQAWDADLDCYAALTGTGIVRRTGSGTCSAGTAVANSELATMASGTFKGNVSGSSATPSDLTASQVLDAIGSTRGSILYRGASGWSLLAPGASGYALTSNGSGADPSYQDIGGGGGGLSDTDRRNVLLDRVYQSKLMGASRRVIDVFADGFKAVDGIDSGSSSNYVADTIGGYVIPSASAGTAISDGAGTAIGNMTSSGGLSAAFSGSNGKLYANSSTTSVGGAPGYIGKNFTGSPKAIHSATVYATTDLGFDGTAGATTITWTLYGSQTAPSTWTDGTILGTTGAFADATGISKTIASNDKTTKWNYVWFYGTTTESGGAGEIAIARAYFLPPSYADMTLVSSSQVTDTSKSSARVLIEFGNGASPSLNTDITVDVTCDGGANWSAATLSAVTAHSQGSRSVAETADTACTSGTSFAYRIKTFNNVALPIYGTSISVF
jgi:hypothetical protein